MARADTRGAGRHPDPARPVVELTGAPHHRPCHRPVPRAPLRPARRSGPRLRSGVPEPRPRLPPHRGRVLPPGHVPSPQPGERGDVRVVVGSPHAGGGHPHAHARRGGRGARLRGDDAGTEGGALCRLRATALRGPGGQGSRRVGLHVLARSVRHRLRLRLRPGMGQGPGARRVDRLPLRLHRDDPLPFDLELCVQPPVDAGGGAAVAGQVAVAGRGHPTIPLPQLRLPRGRVWPGPRPSTAT